MNSNLRFLKYLLPFNTIWFWFGIWLLYYLRITDYAGIGILEASMFFVGLIIEIPTGAISDLFGKKKTLISALIFNAAGNIYMSTITTYEQLFFSLFLLVVGSALYSGAAEAIVYDSLKSKGKQSDYDDYWSLVERNRLVLLSAASAVGGFLYTIEPGLPFLVTGLFQLLGAGLIFFLISEPPIDTEKFEIKTYLKKNFSGFQNLFNKKSPILLIIGLFLITAFITILDNLIDNAYAIELGFEEYQLGLLFAILPIIAAIGANFYTKMNNKFDQYILFLFTAITYLLTAIIGGFFPVLILGSIFIGYRSLVEPIINIYSSKIVNENTTDQDRSTSISTFAMLKQLPYILSAYFLGTAMDATSSANVMAWLGIAFLVIFSCVLGLRSIYNNQKL